MKMRRKKKSRLPYCFAFIRNQWTKEGWLGRENRGPAILRDNYEGLAILFSDLAHAPVEVHETVNLPQTAVDPQQAQPALLPCQWRNHGKFKGGGNLGTFIGGDGGFADGGEGGFGGNGSSPGPAGSRDKWAIGGGVSIAIKNVVMNSRKYRFRDFISMFMTTKCKGREVSLVDLNDVVKVEEANLEKTSYANS
ncbi:hypothetical protein CDL15_Pgr023924 [Punica granatum]|uniref:Uncharacterized protein n=1 Tax=Punica granatum TaxID=22663 RepID=A0A218XWB3_PUNGR|nr:hypothetical protein CDL15_Pgr023924 [Punica granatum]